MTFQEIYLILNKESWEKGSHFWSKVIKGKEYICSMSGQNTNDLKVVISLRNDINIEVIYTTQGLTEYLHKLENDITRFFIQY